MSAAGQRLIAGMTEAVAIARGEQPAARITMQGQHYVPETELEEAQAEIDHWRDRWRVASFGLDASAAVAADCRKYTLEILGTNCAWVDDDLRLLAHLADRAVEAGLTDKLPATVQTALSDEIVAIRKGA